MKSRASFFNPALAGNMFRRRWPFWLGVFAVFFLILPMSLLNAIRTGSGEMDHVVLGSLEMLPLLCAALCLFAAALQFAFLYNTRSCGLMNALPLKRVTVFGTAWLMGLLPLLGAQVLVALFTLAFSKLYSVKAATVLLWLASVVCCTLCFYGIAVFCAMLTGNLLVLPALYVVLNLVSPVIWSCIGMLRDTLSYGFLESYEHLFEYLCPGAELMQALYWARWNGNTPPSMTIPILYAIVGLVLSVCALLLYQRRRMETATDPVAIAWLKPVFLYCMAGGTALVLPLALHEILNTPLGYGRKAFWFVLVLLLLGAAVGWIAGRMILEKSVRVLHGSWRGLLIVCLVLVLLCCCIEFDWTGFETRIPALSEVESISLGGDTVVREADNIAAALALHQNLIAHKSEFDRESFPFEGEDAVYGREVRLYYTLKNGNLLSREYRIFGTASELDEATSPLAQYAALMNTQEAIESRAIFLLPVSTDTVSDSTFSIRGESYRTYALNAQQAVDFYENALLPDLREGKIARFAYGTEGIEYSNTEFYLHVAVPEKDYPDFTGLVQHIYMSYGPTWDAPQNALWETKFYQIPMDAAHCLEWIRENTEIEPVVSDIQMSYGNCGVG